MSHDSNPNVIHLAMMCLQAPDMSLDMTDDTPRTETAVLSFLLRVGALLGSAAICEVGISLPIHPNQLRTHTRLSQRTGMMRNDSPQALSTSFAALPPSSPLDTPARPERPAI